MNRAYAKNRRLAFGMISHITPIALPVFLILFYAPFIAAPLHANGWSKSAAFAAGLAIPALYMGTGFLAMTFLPRRFDKLASALAILVLGLPIVGMPAVIVWELVR